MKPERPALDWTDAVLAAGVGLVCYGLWSIYAPLSFIAAGLFLFWFGLKAGE